MRTPSFVGIPLGLVAIALSAFLAAGGAATDGEAVNLGLPGALAGGAILTVAVSLWVRRDASLAVAAGLIVPLVMLVAGMPLAGVRALSGPPLAAFALAGLVCVAARAGFRLSGPLFLPLVFGVLVVAAGRSHVQVGPEGDEPHYLMVADSLLRDGDLSLERDYAQGRYSTFHDAPLAPHYRVRGKGGEIYSLHALGLSILILPAWAALGYPGVTVFMALLATLVVREVREWVDDLTNDSRLAEAAGWLAALSPPLIHYAGLVFTEVPAALALSLGLRMARRPRLELREAIAIGCAAAALPWLNVRYAPLAAVVVAHALWRHPRVREMATVLIPCAVSGGGLLLYHRALYGFWDPRRVYGRSPEFSLATLAEGLPGLLLDQEFGLLVYAPVLAIALPGFVWLFRRDKILALAGGAAVAAVVLTAGSWHMWRGGFNPPARFLVPIAPLLVVAVALVWQKRGLTAGGSLLVGWTLFTGLAGAWEPRLVHRDRDGTAPLFRELSGAREWTGLLPGYVLSDPERHRLAAVWGLALLAAIPWRTRPASGVRLAGASLGLALAAQAAASVSQQRTDDRDAVRLVGRPALRVPGWSMGVAIGRWGPEPLGWGPLYEPHRHPAGAELGRRLALPPGRYRLKLLAQDLAVGEVSFRDGPGVTAQRVLSSGAPTLVVAPDTPGAATRLSSFTAAPDGWTVSLVVLPGERAVNLLLKGGGPLLLRELVLEVQPPAEAPV